MSHYSQGCAGDGPCILMDGEPMTPEQIVEKLNDLESVLRMVEDNDIARYMRTGSFGVGLLVRKEIQRAVGT